MALSTALCSDEGNSGASEYRNYISAVHDMIITGTSSLMAAEIGLAKTDSGESGCTDFLTVLQDLLLSRSCSHLATEQARIDSGAAHETKSAVEMGRPLIKPGTESRERDETATSLPEDVLEMIIARLPFHYLFQARLVSRRWASIILSPGSSATIFQREIMENSLSSAWDFYCPIYVGMNGLIGYNLVSKFWEKILNLSYLPISEAEFRGLKLGNTAGALLSFFSINQYANNKLHVWVTNPLNRSWRLLHPFSLTRRSKIVLVHMESVGAYGYKLIVITADHILVEGPDSEVFLGAQVYHSSSRCWTRYDPCTKRIDWMNVVSKWCSAFVRETLYIMGQIVFCEPVLVAYNTKDELWSRVTIYSPQPSTRFWSEAMLFACGTKTMIVNVRRDSGRIVTICELDHKPKITNAYGETEQLKVESSSSTSWNCSQMTSLQLPLLFTGPVMKIASDDRALYFFVPRDGSATCEELDVRVFDVHKLVWSSLPHSRVLPIRMPLRFRESYKWAKSAFHPGLNPFVET